ncbi:hypothetical protein VE01_06436 [Pseudogymnoascus verrucosus]|uniref:SHSP domain-containing protein n=1 Tax=Pseudogymnoascus verrucosus TaxID=342668 RepID=A0A1B8GIU3_9PEZI|nr:uncharacterized protein VE01_06436 [Pseudogymnoascus verrucosus]OBT95738.1 hypothetical protein VE01_06436 [Pseudogymnoascus verrucosus]
MAYPNNPLFELLRALDPQQANQQTAAEQPSAAQPQAQGAEATGAAPEQPQHPFAAFAPFFPFPQQAHPHPHHGGGGRRGGPGRRCGPRGECPAMNPEARGPLDAEAEGHGPHHGRHGHGGGRHGRGGWGREPPAYAAFGGQGMPFDISAFVNSLASHPIAEALRTCVDEAARAGGAAADPNTAPAEGEARGAADESDAFAPAVDTFSTPTEYVLHVALPGARKEDVGVNWDAEKGELNIAGVVYRAGDEEFIASLKTGERRVGVFERSVKLPLEGDEKVEVDGEEISAKLEDGVLVVRVGKVVREEAWTDLKRVEVL